MAISNKLKRKELILYGALAGIILAVFFIQNVNAIIVSAPNTPILTGDIDSDEILDRTITDVDISNTAAISGTKIRVDAPQFSVLLSNGTTIGTTTTLTHSTTTNTTTITGNIAVTGNTTINGVTYTWPAADATGNQGLQSNGAGTLSWATSGSWVKLGEITTNTASTGVQVSGIAARRHILIRATLGKPLASANYVVINNVCPNGNYATRFEFNNGVSSSRVDDAQLTFITTPTGATSTFVMEMENGTTTDKQYVFRWQEFTNPSTAISYTRGAGGCAGSKSQATSFNISVSDLSTSMGTGTNMIIYGSDD